MVSLRIREFNVFLQVLVKSNGVRGRQRPAQACMIHTRKQALALGTG